MLNSETLSLSESFKYPPVLSLFMEELRIKIPEELKSFKQVSDIEWSTLVSKLIKSKLDKIAKLKKGLSKSKLTEEDVEEFSDKINTSLSKRYLE